MDFKIRPATPADRDIIAEFNLALALETENLRLDPAVVFPGVEAILRDPAKGLYFVAEVGDAVVGQVMITYEWSDWRNGQLWWLQSVYVHQAYRGHGIFKALFQHLVLAARQQKEVCGLRLYMEAANDRARAVYQRLGMKETHYHIFEHEFQM